MKRKLIVHPVGLLKGKPDLSKPPPFLHMTPYMKIVYMPDFLKKQVCFQIYAFGEYGVHTDTLWRWEGSCICGVMYEDPDPKVVKKEMQEHIRQAGHEPGRVYTLPGQAKHLEAKRNKNRSTYASTRSSVRKGTSTKGRKGSS